MRVRLHNLYSLLLILVDTLHELLYSLVYLFLAVPYDVTGHPPMTMMTTTTNETEADDRGDRWEEVLTRHLATTRFVVQNILNPMVVAFGLVGNSVNMAVLTRRWMKSSTNYYLTALALYDILYLALAFIMSLHHYHFIPANHDYFRYRRPLLRPLTDTCSNTGVWITLTFTVERYIGVCHPMRGKVWCTPRRAKYIIGAVCLSAALITAPEFFDLQATETVHVQGETNTTQIDIIRTAFGQTSFYVGYSYAMQALFTFLPLLLLLIFNTLLIRQVMVSAKNRRRMAKKPDAGSAGDPHSRDQQKITIMLISVVIVFLLCQLPQSLQNLYEIYLDVTAGTKTAEKSLLLRITGNVFNLLVMINGACNFILYSSFSTKFRLTFSRLFCRCLATNSRPFSGAGGGGGTGGGGATSHDYYSEVISTRVKAPTTTCSSKQSYTLAGQQSYSTSISCTVHSWK